MLSEERRCCLRRGGDHVKEMLSEEMLSEERRCCHEEGDLVVGEEMPSRRRMLSEEVVTSEKRRGDVVAEGGDHVRGESPVLFSLVVIT
jgi:hypothetical protein